MKLAGFGHDANNILVSHCSKLCRTYMILTLLCCGGSRLFKAGLQIMYKKKLEDSRNLLDS